MTEVKNLEYFFLLQSLKTLNNIHDSISNLRIFFKTQFKNLEYQDTIYNLEFIS